MNDATTNDPVSNAVAKALAKYPKAKTTAVENFVWSSVEDRYANSGNLGDDARSYKWNAPTVAAIRMALKELDKI